MKISAKRINPELWDDVETFFNYKGKSSGCWCMNHRLNPSEVVEGDPARDLLKRGIASGEVNGLLIYDGEKVVGWCAIDRMKNLVGHDFFDKNFEYSVDDWSIHCLCLIDEYKNCGLEKKIISYAMNFLKEEKAACVQAYPEVDSRAGEPFKTWNTFCGFESDYIEFGFKKPEC